jgi:hypothetical protein
LQLGAPLRPVITKRSCTAPSLAPSEFRLNRASRTGPFCVMNHGTVFFAPFKLATSDRGFRAGLDPPASGCEWQEKHWFELKLDVRGREEAANPESQQPHRLALFSGPLKDSNLARSGASQWGRRGLGRFPRHRRYFRFAHRARAAFFAISLRCSGVSREARTWPPLRPYSRPVSWRYFF